MELARKTIFILDHGVHMREPSGVTVEIETGGKSSNHQPAYLPFSFIPPITKKIWTHVVENTLEYARIVYDLFSDVRPLRFLLNDANGTVTLNTWSSKEQTHCFINEAFAVAGPPAAGAGSFNVGMKAALKCLSQPTPYQNNERKGYNHHKVVNKGRIVFVTSVLKDEDMENMFEKALLQHNESIASSDRYLQIDECEFDIISVHPLSKDHLARILPHGSLEVSALLSTQVIVATPDDMNEKFVKLCVAHHDLVSLTVTGIPMKEEQKSQASFNYDVPLYHPRMSRNGPNSQVLRWSTPSSAAKGSGDSTLHPCNSVVRITPIDVTSRPSSCLSNFVINGRSVGLESPKKNKTMTHNHILTNHGVEMWMHSIETTRNVLEDPPSISELLGGRVTDYRIPDFVEFMKQNMLVPYQKNFVDKLTKESSASGGSSEKDPTGSKLENHSTDLFAQPKDVMKQRLIRKTKYWPMTISGSILFPMAVHLEKLLQLMPLDVLTDAEESECDKTIWALMSIEARGEAPPIPSAHLRKGHKRDEQWRLVYAEVETFVRANLHSEKHKKILECFLLGRMNEQGMTKKIEGIPFRSDTDGARRDDSNKMKKEELLEGNSSSKESIKNLKNNVYESPLSPDSVGPSCTKRDSWSDTQKISLATLWHMKYEKKDLRALPTNVKLYSSLKADGPDKSDKTK